MIKFFKFGSLVEIEKQYRRLRSDLHPDKGGSADEFRAMTKEYEEIKAGIRVWVSESEVDWSANGFRYRLNHLIHGKSCNGSTFYSPSRMVTFMPEGSDDLVENAVVRINAMRGNAGPSRALKERNLELLPEVVDQYRDILLVTKKGVPLASVLKTYGPFTQSHITWIIGRILHILCMLEYGRIAHGDISTESLLVDLADHKVSLQGFWYATPEGLKHRALPARSVSQLQTDVANKKLDWNLAHATVLELMGCRSISEVRMTKGYHKELVKFMSTPWVGDDARKLYSKWEDVRDSFGPRKFVVFEESRKLENYELP